MNRLPSTTLRQTSDPYSESSICFRTRSDGRFPIAADWVTLFRKMEELNRYYLQTRHTYARLVVSTIPLHLSWEKENALAVDADKRLFLRPSQLHETLGLVQHCDCCDSPGRIEFMNQHGLEVMQICAPSSVPASQWAKTLLSIDENLTDHRPKDHTSGIAIVPGNSKRLPLPTEAIEIIFDGLIDNDVSCIITLATGGIVHRERFTPALRNSADNFVTIASGDTTLQFGLAPIKTIYRDESKPAKIYLAGPSNEQILAIEAATPEDEVRFSSILDHLSQHS